MKLKIRKDMIIKMITGLLKDARMEDLSWLIRKLQENLDKL